MRDMHPIVQIRREREAISYGILGAFEQAGGHVSLFPTKLAQDYLEEEHFPNWADGLSKYDLEDDRLTKVAVNRLSGMLVGSVYEILREDDEQWDELFSDQPEMQFLRHIRHGVYHGNRFNFYEDEPKNAIWRGSEITSNMEGQPVFTEIKILDNPDLKSDRTHSRPELVEGFMEAGDAFALINDVTKLAKAEYRGQNRDNRPGK